jgi:hypothetical protein
MYETNAATLGSKQKLKMNVMNLKKPKQHHYQVLKLVLISLKKEMKEELMKTKKTDDLKMVHKKS